MGIAGMVLGILGIIFCWIPCAGIWALVFSIPGIILSALGIKSAKKTGKGKGMAIAGLVMNIIAIACAVLWIVVLGGAAAAA